MSTSTLSIERRPDGVFSSVEQQALVGFIGGYSGLTRDAYALDLRQFAAWCQQRQLALFDVARADIESFARQLEDIGRARATIARRLCTITALYRYAVEEGLLERSPAVHVRRPRLDYESNATGLDRNEVGAMLVAAGLAGAREHALISLLALNGLRVTEAIGAALDLDGAGDPAPTDSDLLNWLSTRPAVRAIRRDRDGAWAIFASGDDGRPLPDAVGDRGGAGGEWSGYRTLRDAIRAAMMAVQPENGEPSR